MHIPLPTPDAGTTTPGVLRIGCRIILAERISRTDYATEKNAIFGIKQDICATTRDAKALHLACFMIGIVGYNGA